MAPGSALLRDPRWALFVLVFGVYAYFYQGGGWNQNSRFDLTRAIVEQGTACIDAYEFNTGDKARVEGRYYCDKAPGVSFLAVPVYAFNGIGAHAVGSLLGKASPGTGDILAASLLGGLAAVVFVIAVAYYGSIAAVRLGADPDTYGIPIVTSSVDFAGAVMLILAIVVVGVA